MPRSLPKRSAKKKIAAPVAPAGRILEMKPSRMGWHHGLALGTVILIVVAIGAIAAAVLEYRNLAPAVKYAQNASNRIDELSKQNSDLSQQLTDLRTVNQLAAKSPPADIVLDTYTSPNLSLQYPDGYTVVKATASFPALTIKSDKGRLEIFRMKDFPGGIRPAGCGATAMGMSDEDIDKYCPKDMLTTGIDDTNSKVFPYNVWLYYNYADQQTKAIFDQIVASIKVIK